MNENDMRKVWRYEGEKNAYRFSVRKSGGKRQRGRLRHRWKGNI
jgi:hypothetical protein